MREKCFTIDFIDLWYNDAYKIPIRKVVSSFFSYLLAFVLALSPLVFIHELGHYLMARAFGVKVDCFSIGFGPSLISWKDRHGTRWQISALLFGGYVKMAGDDNVASSHGKADRPDSLHAQAPWKRILIGAAGPGANYALAFVLLTTLMVKFGQPMAQRTIEKVVPASVAEKYGFKTGQILEKVNGTPIENFEGFRNEIKKHDHLIIQVSEDGVSKDILMPKPEGRLGLKPSEIYKPVSLNQAIMETLHKMNPVAAIKEMRPGNMGGPLSIGHDAGAIFQEGWVKFLFFMGTISIGLGFFNLLPIPLLDGGMMFFACIEALRGRPLSEQIQTVITNIFGVLLISLFVFFTWRDLGQIPAVKTLLGKFMALKA